MKKMFEKAANIFRKPKEKNELEEAIEIRTMSLVMPNDSAEKDALEIKNLKDLVEIREKLEGPKFRLNPNTVLSAIATLGGIVIIVWHEKFDVVTSKALGFVNKPKL